ncbi:MAG: PH domain-containing protein [Clostridia bacterium]|nr:PH domain-containing protein [Clostridia bacterium]
MEQRPYGAYVLYDVRRWWPIFLWPLLHTLVSIGDPRILLREWLLCVALIGYSVGKWKCSRYRVGRSQNGFYSIGVRQGLLVRHSLHIDAEDAASVEIERTPLLALCGGRRVRVNTAGLRRRSDAVLYLSANQVRELFLLSDRSRDRFRARLWPVVVTAITGSNAAVGLLTAAPALRQIGNLLGERFSADAVGVLQRLLAAEIPSALRILANLLVIGWGVAAFNNFLRYVGFYATVQEAHLHLVSGLFTRRDVLIDRDKITALELRQTLFMRLLGLHTAVITAAGYGRDIGARPVLIPAADPRTLCEGLERLLPGYPLKTGRIKAARNAWWRYLASPLIVILFSILPWMAGGFWQVPALVCTVWGIWWFIVRFLGFRGAGFGADREAVTVWYPRGLALYRVYLPREVVDHVTVTQSVWQRHTGTCTVTVRSFGDKKRRHRVWGLPYTAVLYEIGI